MSFVNIETKEDSAEKLAQAAGKPTKNFLFAPEFNLLKNKVNEFYEAFILALNGKANVANVRTGNFTPAINTVNHVTANASVANPTGVEGLGYEIRVLNGNTTLPTGDVVGTGVSVIALFHSGNWQYSIFTNQDLRVVASTNISTSQLWQGRIISIDNGSNDIEITVNHNLTCSGIKEGSGTVNFVNGSSTIIEVNSVSLLTSGGGSTFALKKRFSGTPNQVYLLITNI